MVNEGGADFYVSKAGADQLASVGRRLKAAGDEGKGLRKELLAEIRKAGKPTIQEIRARAREILPHSGGLADRVASAAFGVRTRLAGNRVGVEIKGTGRSVKNLRAINAGRLRKPVFGNRQVWAEQSVEPGFFDEPIEANVPVIRQHIKEAMQATARKIERG